MQSQLAMTSKKLMINGQQTSVDRNETNSLIAHRHKHDVI